MGRKNVTHLQGEEILWARKTWKVCGGMGKGVGKANARRKNKMVAGRNRREQRQGRNRKGRERPTGREGRYGGGRHTGKQTKLGRKNVR